MTYFKVAAALLVDGRTSIHDKELFMNIVSLSYLGKGNSIS